MCTIWTIKVTESESKCAAETKNIIVRSQLRATRGTYNSSHRNGKSIDQPADWSTRIIKRQTWWFGWGRNKNGQASIIASSWCISVTTAAYSGQPQGDVRLTSVFINQPRICIIQIFSSEGQNNTSWYEKKRNTSTILPIFSTILVHKLKLL